MAGLPVGRRGALRLQLLRPAVRLGRAPDQGRQGLRLRPVAGRGARLPRQPDRAGQEQPVPRAQRRGEPRPVRAHEGRRIPRRRPRAARQDRHGVAEHEPARPDPLSHPSRPSPPDRRQVVHLPELRLHPRPVGRHRRGHPLDLHPGVRGSPPAVRVVPGQPAGAGAAAPVRIRPPQPELHHHQQAQAQAAGR
ncbi:hypothetical protein D3C78_1118180 [compost metagenome]